MTLEPWRRNLCAIGVSKVHGGSGRMTEDAPRMDRRAFLSALGRTAGGSAMLRAMAAMGIATTVPACGSSSASPAAPQTPAPPPPPQTTTSPRPGDWPANVGAGKSVVILGAGIAGMTAALEMTRLGYACTILEAQSTAGGRNRTIRAGDVVDETDSSQLCTFDADDGLYFNAGPSRISHHHEFLLGYCREFGVALETFTNDNRAARLHSTGAFGGQAQMARRVIGDTRGHIAALLATAIDQGALDQQLTATDRANVLQMLQIYGDLDGAFAYSGSSRAGFPGQESTGSRQRGALLAPLALQELAADLQFGLRSSFAEGLDQQPTMLQPVGGMDRIAAAFEAQVANSIIFNAVVTEVRKTAAGVRVGYDLLGSPTSIDADYCMPTIPAPVLANIPNDFSAAHRTELAGFQYSSAVRLAFQSRRFWEQDHNIYGGISWTDQEITQLWYPNHGFGAQHGIMLGAYIFGGPAGTAFTNRTPQQRIDAAITQASNVHAQMATEATRGISVAWKKMPWSLGAWGASTPAALLTPDDAIFFAGEHLSILQGWQEGAILSAYHAIDGIVTRDTP